MKTMPNSEGYILFKRGTRSVPIEEYKKYAGPGYSPPHRTETYNLATRLKTRKINWFTDEELMQVPTGDVWVFDAECYINFFYINIITT